MRPRPRRRPPTTNLPAGQRENATRTFHLDNTEAVFVVDPGARRLYGEQGGTK